MARLQNLGREIGADDLDLPAGELRAHFRKDHRQRIAFLARRAGGRPDADGLRRRARLQQRRQADLLELVERLGVAEEEGFVRGHRFDHVADDRFVILGADEAHEIVEGRQLPLARDRQQAAFQQIRLVVGQQQARPGLEDLAR